MHLFILPWIKPKVDRRNALQGKDGSDPHVISDLRQACGIKGNLRLGPHPLLWVHQRINRTGTLDKDSCRTNSKAYSLEHDFHLVGSCCRLRGLLPNPALEVSKIQRSSQGVLDALELLVRKVRPVLGCLPRSEQNCFIFPRCQARF